MEQVLFWSQDAATCLVQVSVWTRTYLVANGLWAAPLQQDLFDTAGTGNTETLRALQFGFGLFGSVEQKRDWLSNTIPSRGTHGREPGSYLTGSVFILSNMALLAWAPLGRDSTCALVTSCLNSVPVPAQADFLQGRVIRNSTEQTDHHGSDTSSTGLNSPFQTGRESRFDYWFRGQ